MENNKESDKATSDPKNWKLKIFYFNKADNRAIVPGSNSKLGPTLNLANPKAILFLISVFVLVLLMLIIRDTF